MNIDRALFTFCTRLAYVCAIIVCVLLTIWAITAIVYGIGDTLNVVDDDCKDGYTSAFADRRCK